MADEEAIKRKWGTVVVELTDYITKTHREFSERLDAARRVLAPSALEEVLTESERLRNVSEAAHRDIAASEPQARKDLIKFQQLLERNLAALEMLNEGVKALTRRLDELLAKAP
jgi:hypothetical protein